MAGTLELVSAVVSILFVIVMIILALYIIYYLNNQDNTKTIWIFGRKNRMQKCPCGGHSPRDCKCRH